MKDKLNLSEHEMRKFEIGKKLAEEFLPTKTRGKAYKVEGYDSLFGEESNIELTQYLVLTDDEKETLKNYILECFNKEYPEFAVDTWEAYKDQESEVVDEEFFLDLNETPGCWKDLITDVLEGAQMAPYSIDFDDFEYFYRFSCFIYGPVEKKIYGPNSFIAILSDEDYCTLLALQLSIDRGLTYNNLWLISPELATKISDKIVNLYMNTRIIGHQDNVPFTVIFDELIEDAKTLKEEYEKRTKDNLRSLIK